MRVPLTHCPPRPRLRVLCSSRSECGEECVWHLGHAVSPFLPQRPPPPPWEDRASPRASESRLDPNGPPCLLVEKAPASSSFLPRLRVSTSPRSTASSWGEGPGSPTLALAGGTRSTGCGSHGGPGPRSDRRAHLGCDAPRVPFWSSLRESIPIIPDQEGLSTRTTGLRGF